MDNNNSFLDKNTLLAIGLTLVIFIGWSGFMEKYYPNTTSTSIEKTAETKSGETLSLDSLPAQQSSLTNESPSNKKEDKVLLFETESFSFKLHSLGLGISDFRLKEYTDRENEAILIANTSASIPNSLSSSLGESTEAIAFDLVKLNDYEFSGTANVDGVNVVKKYILDPKNYSIDVVVTLSSDKGLPKYNTFLGEMLLPPAGGSLFAPATEIQEVYIAHKKGEDRHIFSTAEAYSGSFNEVNTVAISSHYFSAAILDNSNIIPNVEFQTNQSSESIVAKLSYPSFIGTKEAQFKYRVFIGPKSLSLLNSIDLRLKKIIDLGWFAFIGEPLLKFLIYLYKLVENWGFAIILLTIAVRLLVMPFNVMSYKSMKKMQEIQPALKAVREKYAKDQVRMNQEVMALMKDSKVNPMGGCLPMLLQLPIFIALYRVLGQSIELYKSPFLFWITDLSLKDPFYVLPILMGISMFIQQKITPSTMDPAQQKMMMFMPLIFSLFMIALPSGLTLYIFVSTLFGIIQQQLFLKKA